MPNRMKIIRLLYLEFCIYKIFKDDIFCFNVMRVGFRKNLGQFLIKLKIKKLLQVFKNKNVSFTMKLK
ncbi:hypothetical protein CVD08_11560 [Acinetobacter seifertii]|nr:hypothetical protein CVD06_18330 [Acinetobacter seifertii]PJG70043.1 hypothetical protein CVD08_11560 [Acinetobacter seifertii]